MTTLLLVANILGYIGLVMLYSQVVFGSRHVFKYITRDTVKVNAFHEVVGKYSVFAVLLHPIIMMMAYLENFAWVITPNFSNEIASHTSMGRFAVVLFLVVWITSAIVRGKIKWRPWKYVHLLSYPIVFFTLIHMKDLGTLYMKYPLLQTVHAALFILFILAILVRLLTWSGLTKNKYTIISKTLVGKDIYYITLKPQGKSIHSTIGQHFFLQTKRFGSEHPFSIVRNNNGELSFGIRRVGDFWRELESKNVGDTMYVDGPYGVFTREGHNNEPKVIISAGVGATPFVALAEQFGKGAVYINCNRSIAEALEREAVRRSVDKYVDIVESYDGAPQSDIKVGRITAEIIKEVVGEGITTRKFFVCGSPVFIKIIKGMLAEAGVQSSQVYIEKLGF